MRSGWHPHIRKARSLFTTKNIDESQKKITRASRFHQSNQDESFSATGLGYYQSLIREIARELADLFESVKMAGW
jgi:hypothetical protein